MKEIAFADNLFPPPSGIALFAQPAKPSITAGPQGLMLKFDQAGNHTIGVKDVTVRTISIRTLHGADHYLLPKGVARAGRIPADSPRSYLVSDPTLTFGQALDSLDRALRTASPSSYSHYDATAITPVASFSFDPKPLMGSGIFGPKDLVLYGEAALL